jgi:RNA polymerase sigma-70 factor (ECF subfamily)
MNVQEEHGEIQERELIEAAIRGDRTAFKRLYDLFRDRVYNLAFYSLGEALWAEDVLQTVFLKIYRGLPRFRYEAGLSTWIYRITLNECKNQLRRRGPRQVRLDEILGSDEDVDPRALPDADHLDRERREVVQEALLQLSPKLRGAVVLKYIEGLSYEEIARVLDCAPGTVASRLNRALAELEARLHPLRRIL